MDEKINILPLVSGGGGGQDATTAMAMMNNNPWMYLVMLALFGNGGFGNRGTDVNGVLDMETQNKLNSLQSQINDNNNNAWAREAITSNGNRAEFAISQLSQNLGVGVAELRQAIAGIGAGIAQLGSQNGMGFAGVTNAINLGNLNIVQQLKDCCCGIKTQIIEQGYQNQLQTVNQTNELQNSQRVAEKIVSDMNPRGPFSFDVWRQSMRRHEFALDKPMCYNEYALWVTMNMIMSDSSATLERYVGSDKLFSVVYCLAVDHLTDIDGKFSIRGYIRA